MAFRMAHVFYGRCTYVFYGSYGPPIGNPVINCYYSMLLFEVVDQNCDSTYTYDGTQELFVVVFFFSIRVFFHGH